MNVRYQVRLFIILLSVAGLFSACGEKGDHGSQIDKKGVGSADISDYIDDPKSDGPTVIGAFMPSSDTAAKLFEQGAQIALSNGSTSSFELRFLDIAQGRSPDAAQLKTLIEKEKAPAVLYWTSDDIEPVASYLSDAGAVGVVLEEVTNKVIRLGHSIYGFGYSTELTFEKLAKFAGNTLKSYRFALITANQPRFDLQSKAFIEESKSLGNTIVFEEKVAAENVDFSSLIARASKEKCDTIFAVLPNNALVQLIKAARASQYKGKIIIGDTLTTSDLKAVGQDAEGIYAVQAWSDDANLKSLYSTKFGNIPDGVSLGFVALGYDTVKCLQSVNTPIDASSIKNSFLSTPCEGLTGKTQFTGERIAQRRQKILTVKGGQFVIAE